MSDESPRAPLSGDLWVHAPLPYYAKLRVTNGDDAAPQTIEWRGYAYSPMEAMNAAFMMVSAAPLQLEEQRNIKVEDLGPDLVQYAKDFGQHLGPLVKTLATQLGVKLT